MDVEIMLIITIVMCDHSNISQMVIIRNSMSSSNIIDIT